MSFESHESIHSSYSLGEVFLNRLALKRLFRLYGGSMNSRSTNAPGRNASTLKRSPQMVRSRISFTDTGDESDTARAA